MPECKLFVAVAGRHAGPRGFSSHEWLATLVDSDGNRLWSNESERPKARDGTQTAGLYNAIHTAIESAPNGCKRVVLYSPQHQQLDPIFGLETREHRRAKRYKGANKKPRPHADWLKAIDDLSEMRGIELTTLRPSSDWELELLEYIRAGVAIRYEDACEAAGSDFG